MIPKPHMGADHKITASGDLSETSENLVFADFDRLEEIYSN